VRIQVKHVTPEWEALLKMVAYKNCHGAEAQQDIRSVFGNIVSILEKMRGAPATGVASILLIHSCLAIPVPIWYNISKPVLGKIAGNGKNHGSYGGRREDKVQASQALCKRIPC
jgi:hypothetical protein